MAAVKRFIRRVGAFLRPNRAEQELDRELTSHLALLEDEYGRRGLSPDDARQAARRSLGNVAGTKDLHRDARSFRWLDDARRDVRYALRSLRRDRSFTTVAVLTLALGIGAVTTMFSGVDAVLLRKPPFPAVNRLVFVGESFQGRRGGVTAPDWMDWQRDQRVFENMAAYASTTVTLVSSNDPVRLPARRVSSEYFRTLGVRPAIGRDFLAGDDVFGAPATVLVSDALWRGRFQADRSLVGRSILLNGVNRVVIGILPPAVNLRERTEQFYLPLALTPDELASPGSRAYTVIARLKGGVSIEQASSAMAAIAAAIGEIRPNSNRDIGVRLEGFDDVLVGDLRQPLWFFMGAVALLLFIVCANIANLQLVRTTARQREVAIRAAIGAGRGRLVRQFVIEGLVIGLIGGAAGWFVATWSLDLVPWLVPAASSRLSAPGLSLRVGALATGLSLAAGLLFSLAPAWQVARRDLRAVLNDGARNSTGVDRHRLSAIFVVVETALALVLLVGSGLMVRSVSRLNAVDPGFRPDDTVALRISLPDARYGAADATTGLFDRLLDRTRGLPGVISAGGASSLPLRDPGASLDATIDGRPVPIKMADYPRFFYRGVTPDYFKTIGVPVLKGREFSPADRAGRPRTGVINETAARRYWPQGDAVGARIEPDDGGDSLEIVGIVGDTRHFGLGEETAPELFIAIAQAPAPYWRWTQRTLDVVVHTSSNADVVSLVRAAVREIDPMLPVSLVTPMRTIVSDSLSGPLHTMVLVTVCAGIALLLAALGMYGVIASIVRDRTREIGVRVALGAARRDILTLVVGRSLRLCLIGLVIGAVAAFALRHVIATFLVGIASSDGLTYAAVVAILLMSTAVASYAPARRALNVDPVRALRND